MKSKFPKVLILGATGMLGRMVHSYLSNKYSNVYGTSRKQNSKFSYLNAQGSVVKFEQILAKIKPVYVINCIGALKDKRKNILKRINSGFPKIVSRLSEKYHFKIINISTDAVFGNSQNEVNEDSTPVPNDEYGKSKMIGEQKTNTLNIRTSILGFDPNKHKGLLEFLIKKGNNTPIGFINQKWSGSTVLQLSKYIEDLIYNGKFTDIYNKTKVIHFAPLKPLSKYEIVESFTKLLRLKKPEKKIGQEINRTLKSRYISKKELKHYGKSIEKSLRELVALDKSYVKNYKN